jgi:8-oxo-dGTP pyrophosphatase MutT (NUDIX family)
MPAQKISIQNAKEDKLFYFVANVVVYRAKDARCLILKRSATEQVHAGKWCVPGGKLEWNHLDITHSTRMNGEVLDFEDAVEELLAREVQEEAGIEIQRKLYYINSVAYVRPDGVPTMLVKFVALYAKGEVVLDKRAFDEYAWANAEEVKQYDCIVGIPKEIGIACKIGKAKVTPHRHAI